jgi:hypothetical protein
MGAGQEAAQEHGLGLWAGHERPEQGVGYGNPLGGKPQQHEARDPPVVVPILPAKNSARIAEETRRRTRERESPSRSSAMSQKKKAPAMA